ncbi:hypothetical protein Bca52824_081331 [Brassica carinata]|uniref:Uncharacterized protein n=1 Tax=Brassica carinata TaxID=52824 RepID=A0A8X7PH11_BRACI|nr:hypothetical protein Bca52824_081331 [Brassica carinata]
MVLFRRSGNGSQASALHHSLCPFSSSPMVLSGGGVPPPGYAHILVLVSCVGAQWCVGSILYRRRLLCSAFNKRTYSSS